MTAAQTFNVSLLSGAVAGFTVDAFLFPLDTLKTRLQVANSPSGAALFKGIYAGFGPAVLASAPAAAAFFGVYDYTKKKLGEILGDSPRVHVLAAAAGDVAGSSVRAPFEVIKQRLQAGMYGSARQAVMGTLRTEGVGGLFKGYGSLIVRELPFDALQFPLYEYLKKVGAKKRGRALETWETCICGSMAGGVSAAVTTPLDVVKTRLMVTTGKYKGIVDGLAKIGREEGMKGLFAGVVPRVIWISLGGAVFFGAYEAARKVFIPVIVKRDEGASKRDRFG